MFWGKGLKSAGLSAFVLDEFRSAGTGTPDTTVVKMQVIFTLNNEVSSCGFWPGGDIVNEPAFYAYAYPEPEGFKNYRIEPPEAFYNRRISEFLLPYDVVRTSNSHDDVLLKFLQSTYEAAATRASWDRRVLERQ